MNEQDFLRLLNEVIKLAKPFSGDMAEVSSMSEDLTAIGMDSLDLLITGVYLCDVLGIDEETAKSVQAITPQTFYDILMAHKTREPSSVEEALKEIQ